MSYSTIGTARSALSFVLPRYNYGSFGEHFLVKKFMKEVYILRTPSPRYHGTWDVRVVFNCFRSILHNQHLSLKLLSLKLVMLVALVSSQRVQSLSFLDLNSTYSVYSSIIFVIFDKTKSSKSGKKAPQVILSPYKDCHKLCVCRTLLEYLRRTKPIRYTSSLFISWQNPHGAVTSQTLSRWVRTVMHISGIDTTLFKAHSTRAASASRAKLSGISIDSILESVGWTNEPTFARFYDKPIIDIEQYNNAVLSVV